MCGFKSPGAGCGLICSTVDVITGGMPGVSQRFASPVAVCAGVRLGQCGAALTILTVTPKPGRLAIALLLLSVTEISSRQVLPVSVSDAFLI